jgi:sulfur carrier protein ThiS
VELSVKLIGHLLDYLPHDGAEFDGRSYVIADRASPRALAADIGLPDDAEYFVMVNGDHVAEDALGKHELQAGDQVVLCPPLKGG